MQMVNRVDYASVMNKNICVFCASRQGDNLNTIAKAGDLGRAIADSGYGLVFGGGRLGLMGVVASAAIEANGHVIGIIPKGLTAREPVQQELKELFVVEDIIERKRLMIERSAAFVILPGGLGTLDELFEVWTGKQVGAHHKPIIIANWDGYYDKLIAFLKQADQHGFLNGDHLDHIRITHSVEELMSTLNELL
jgi:uncharacterized protein (TIGR00730 family)